MTADPTTEDSVPQSAKPTTGHPSDHLLPAPVSRLQRLRSLGPAGIMTVAAALLPFAGLALVVANHERFDQAFRTQLRSDPLWPLATVGIFAVLGGLGLLPTLTMSLFAGWAFGFPEGLLVAVPGIAGSGAVNYLIAKLGGGQKMLEAVNASPRWRAVHHGLLESGRRKTIAIVALLRVPTAPPFGATSIALASLGVRPVAFFVGSMIGVIPRTALYVSLASRMENFDPQESGDWRTLTIAVVATLVVLAIVTVLARRILHRLAPVPTVP